MNRRSRVVERTRPITVLTVYTGDPKHKVCTPNVSSLVYSLIMPKDYGNSVVACRFINTPRGTNGMGKSCPNPSSGWCAPQRGTLTFFVGVLFSPSSPKTERGTLMVTSLANFRSDFTIVQIADGNYLHAREQLWTNINLLRMGLSGRSALTLQKPG